MDTSAIITLGGVRMPELGECAWLAIIIDHMMIVAAPTAIAQEIPGTRALRRSWVRATPFSGHGVRAWQRGLVIVHGLVACFLEVILLAIILLLVGLAVLGVLVVMTRTIMVLIISMTIVGSSVIVIASVTSMIVVIFVAMMLLVAQFMATRNGKMSHLLHFWLPFVPGNLLKCWPLDTAQKMQWAWAGPWAPSCLYPQTRTDAPWAAQRRFVHSSLVPWVSPWFDGGSHRQDSWWAKLNAAWTHASAWGQASWQYEASGSVVGRLYSVQYKNIFGAPTVRCCVCGEARPSRLDFQRDKVKIHHVITSMQDCWSWCRTEHSYVGVQYWTDQTRKIC